MREKVVQKLAFGILEELKNLYKNVQVIQIRATELGQGINYCFVLDKDNDELNNFEAGLTISRIQKNILNAKNLYFTLKVVELDKPIFSDLLRHEYPKIIYRNTDLDTKKRNLYFTC
jgi:hypothetical protein